MTKREFTSIILKLMGVYTLLTYLTQFTVGLVIAGNMIKQNGSLSKNSIEAIAFLLIPICFYIIVPALLIVKSNWVACRLIKNDGEFSLGFTITKEELLTVRGIGEVLAESIITHREELNSFSTVEQLLDVDGIGQKRFDNICGCFTIA